MIPREELKALVDNELSAERRAEVMKAVQADPELQAQVIELRQISRILREETVQPVPEGLERTLMMLNARPEKASRPLWRSPLALAMAACAVFVIAVVMSPIYAQSKADAKRAMLVADRYQQTAGKSDASDTATAPAASNGNIGAESKEDTSGSNASPEPKPATTAKVNDLTFESGAGRGRQNEARSDRGVVMKGEAQPRFADSAKKTTRPTKILADEKTAAPAAIAAATRAEELEIKTANVSLEVVSVGKAQSAAEHIATSLGGKVDNSQISSTSNDLPSAELTLRVPVRQFGTAMDRLRKLGRVITDSAKRDDVTAEVADVEARLKVLKTEEDQYLTILRTTKKIGDILEVKDRLSQVRQEIESLTAQSKVMRAQAGMSTINLSLSQKPSIDDPKPPVADNWLESIWISAVTGLSAVARFLTSALVVLFVFSPIWVPIGGVVWWRARLARR